jgi:hypothetical protein
MQRDRCGRSVRNVLGDVGYKCELEMILHLQSFTMSKAKAISQFVSGRRRSWAAVILGHVNSKGGSSHLCCEAFFRLFPSSPSSPSSMSPKSESSPELSPLSLPSLWDSPT